MAVGSEVRSCVRSRDVVEAVRGDDLVGRAFADVIIIESARDHLGAVGAAAVLGVRADVFVDAALRHAGAALSRGHRFVGKLLVKRLEDRTRLVREALHVEEGAAELRAYRGMHCRMNSRDFT